MNMQLKRLPFAKIQRISLATILALILLPLLNLHAQEKIDRETVYLYTTGKTLQLTGNRQQAVGYLQQAWAKAPQSVEIGLTYAQSLFELRQYQTALDVLDSLSANKSDVQYFRAILFRALGREADAIVAFQKTVMLDSTSSNAHSFLANYYLSTKQNDSALVTFLRLGKLFPENPGFWNEAAKLQIEKNDIDGAKDSYRRSVRADKSSRNFEGVFGITRTQWATGFPDSALPYARLIVQHRPQEANNYRVLASLYGDLDSLPQAILTATQGLGVKPRDPDLRRQLGVLYFDADSLLESEQVLHGLVKDSIADHITFLVLSQVKLRQGDTSAALVAADQATIHFPHLSQTWAGLADLERRRGRVDLALSALDEGLKSSPTLADSTTLHAIQADFLAQDRQFQLAYDAYERALKGRPDDATILNNYGFLLADQNVRVNDAYRMIKKALELRPDAGFILDSYGWVLHRQGKHKEALTYLLKADSLNPNAETSEHVGDVYKAMKQNDKAIEWWKKSVDQNPNRPAVKAKLQLQ